MMDLTPGALCFLSVKQRLILFRLLISLILPYLCSLEKGVLLFCLFFFLNIYSGTGAVDIWFHWMLPSPPSLPLKTISQNKNPNHDSV